MKILPVFLPKFCIDQSGDILWVMYCLIYTMSTSNLMQDSCDLVALCIVVHIFARCYPCQGQEDQKFVAVNLDKYWKSIGCDKQYTEGCINTRLVLELQSGLFTGSIEDMKGCFEPQWSLSVVGFLKIGFVEHELTFGDLWTWFLQDRDDCQL